MKKSAPITGITGQDGACLAAAERDALVSRHGYRAYGGRE